MEDVMKKMKKGHPFDMPERFRLTGIPRLHPLVAVFCMCYAYCSTLPAQSDSEKTFRLAYVKYEGGSYHHARGEMISHEEQLVPNMLDSIRKKVKLNVASSPEIVTFEDKKLFECPIFFITGHYRFTVKPGDIDQLREYIKRGGFAYIEDCGGLDFALTQFGSFFEQMHEVLQKAFPEGEFRVLPNDHDIYKYPYEFPKGLPNFFGRNNDGRPPDTAGKLRKHNGGEGFFVGNTMVAFLGDADNCCGWTGKSQSGDGPFKMAANVVIYAMTHPGL
jgi:hypothetical protein